MSEELYKMYTYSPRSHFLENECARISESPLHVPVMSDVFDLGQER